MLFFGIINNKYNGNMEQDAEYRLLISGFFIPFFNIGKKLLVSIFVNNVPYPLINKIIFIKNIIIVILDMFSIPLFTLYIVVIIRSKAIMEIGVLYKYWEDMKLLMSYRSTILTTMKIIIINIFINVPRYFPYNFSILLLIFKFFS